METQTLFKRVRDETYDFKGVATKYLTHGMHTYPATFIPQVVRKLLDTYGKQDIVVYDPFLGSGTTLVEALVDQRVKEAWGNDINPLARLISKVKTTPINHYTVYSIYERLKQDVETTEEYITGDDTNERVYACGIDLPTFKNIAFWFKEYVIYDLAVLKHHILKVEDKDVRDFLLVAFSETVRQVSNTRKGEYKLYRIPQDALATYKPDVYATFYERVEQNIRALHELEERATGCAIHILGEDTRCHTSLPDKSVDLVITSPPYGDSRTTVAYGQFSRLSLEFCGMVEGARDTDKRSLGGIPVPEGDVLALSPTLKEEVERIRAQDAKRASEVVSFYADLFLCIKEIDRVLKNDGTVCMVVGNRNVRGIVLSTDRIIAELFLSLKHYTHEQTIVREIPTKRLPRAFKAQDGNGKIDAMNYEYVVMLRRCSCSEAGDTCFGARTTP